MTPLISVIMPVYNETILEINQGIRSLINQTYSNVEIIIVDDNPNNKRIIINLQKWNKLNDKIRIIYHNINLGLVKSENDGIRHACGRYIARADADDVSYRNRLSTQYKFLIDNHLDLTSCNDIAGNVNGDVVTNSHIFSTITQCNQNKIKKVISYCNIMSGSNLFFKKSLFNKLNGYRINLVDDYDFVARALVYGARIGYQSEDLIIKRARYNSISNSESIKQFIYTCIISKCLRKFKYSKILPISCFKRQSNNVSKIDSKKYIYFLKYKELFNKNKSICILIRMVLILMSSKILLKKFLWGKLIFNKQDCFLK